jgi:hypothetical protein
LDERVARDCARSGVPFFVEDERVLDMVAGLLSDDALTPPALLRGGDGP